MTVKDKEISTDEIYTYFKERYKKDNQGVRKKHYFIKDSVINKCINFLKDLRDLDKKQLSREQRTVKLSQLSDSTVQLWGLMLKDALDTLDKADKDRHHDTILGISRLKQYLRKFKEFEMLLYGSDKWYRDTIYHQLWFYFVGEYLFSDTGLNIMDQLLDLNKKDWYCEPKNNDIKSREQARYAMFCVIALCHDLGKPLQKIHSINNALRDMLDEYKFLHFSPFKVEFPLTYAAMLNLLVERLGQTGDPDRSKKRLFIEKIEDPYYYVKMKNYREKQPHMQAFFSTALAELNHGMLSCLLLMESFRRFKGSSPYKKWKVENEVEPFKGIWVQKSYLTAQSILKAIAYHNIENIEVIDISLPYFWVCLVDDLIDEFRPTRAGKDFLSPGICKVRINGKALEELYVSYEFTRYGDQKTPEINRDAIHFFVDKLERYYTILQISNFKFTIEVKTKKEKEDTGTLMMFTYEKEKENSISIVFKRGTVDLNDPIKVESFLMVEREKRIEKIHEILEKMGE